VSGGAKTPHGNCNGKNLSMVRVAYQFATGRTVQRNHIVWRTCCTKLCLNPAHMRQGTRANHGQWVREQGNQKGNIKRLNASRASVAARTTITAEAVRQILLSDKPHAEWARELGVCPKSIKRAIERRTEGARNSSVFSWRPAA
jgi:hypothetical protein